MKFKISMAAARVNAGLTQKAVCEAMNISKTTLVSYEKGRTIPTMEMGEEFAKLYKLPIDAINFFNHKLCFKHKRSDAV